MPGFRDDSDTAVAENESADTDTSDDDYIREFLKEQKDRMIRRPRTQTKPVSREEKNLQRARQRLEEAKLEIEELEFLQEAAQEKLEKLEQALSGLKCQDWPKSLLKDFDKKWMHHHESPYTTVRVLITSWEFHDFDDDLDNEIKALRQVFRNEYKYQVERFKIPDLDSFKATSKRVAKFIGNPTKEEAASTLLVFYYTGHGGTKKQRTDHYWSATGNVNGPSMPATGIQVLLEEAQADTLIVYDCCDAADTTVTLGQPFSSGVTELIAACGINASSTVGKDSLTNSLTRELRAAATSEEPISVSELYNRTVARLHHDAPQRGDRQTPVRFVLVPGRDGRQIFLEPLRKRRPRRSSMRSARRDGRDLYGIFLDVDEDRLDVAAMREWILAAPPAVRKVYLQHPNAGEIE